MPSSTTNKPRNLLSEDRFENLQILNEAAGGGALPPGVIARIVGPMAILEGVSLNRRFYSKRMWENSRDNWEPRLGKMFGTLSHDVPLNEASIEQGRISHKVVELYPDEGSGYMLGEIHVLDTPAGNRVNEVWRAGWDIGVSTRAYGDIKNGRGRGPDGSDVIDENSFYLETIDLVITPGAPGAKPRLVESADENNQPQQERRHMDLEKLFETQNKELVDQRVELREALASNQKLNESVDELKSKVALYESIVGTPQSAKKINEGLRKWAELEPFKSLAAEVGLFDAIDMGGPNFMSKAIQITEAYTKHGTPQQLNERETLLEDYKKLGTVESIKQGKSLLTEYTAFKKRPAELTKAFETATKVVELYHGLKKRKVARQLFEKYVTKPEEGKKAPVTEKWINEMLQKLPVDDVKKSIEALAEAAPAKVNGKLTPDGQPKVIPTKPAPVRTADGKIDEGHSVVASIFASMNESYSGEKTPTIFDMRQKMAGK